MEEHEFEKPAEHGVSGFQIDEVLQSVGIVTNMGNGDAPQVIKKYTKEDGSIDENAIYNELASLIASGSNLVKQFQYLDMTAEGVLTGMASLMGELRQSISEFSKVHDRYVKHQQAMKLEEYRERSKMRLLERKHQMDLEKIKLMKKDGDDDETDKDKSSIVYDRNYLIKAISSKDVPKLPNGEQSK
jgi:hypothetical protein